MKKIFIDGKAGTTGLRIYDRLSNRSDIEIITLSEEKRKDVLARQSAINSSDITFLCLPDAAAVEAVSLVENPNTVIIDTSTAHRTNPDWVYGFPEISSDNREKIKNSKRISVPGCHASGFVALIKPLIDNGVLSPDVLLCCTSVTGYSGGGKGMIEQYQSNADDLLLSAPRQYGLTQQHKHLREMTAICKIQNSPAFSPIVANIYSGMAVTIPLFKEYLLNGKSEEDIKKIYNNLYNGPVVNFVEEPFEDGFFSAAKLSNRDSMEISVAGNSDRILLTARYDNLGKGASGAAVQCLNIILGTNETQGLDL